MHILYVQQILVLPGSKGNDRCWAFAKNWVDAGHRVSFLTSTAGFNEENTCEFQKISKHHFIFEGIDVYAVDVDYAHKMSFPKRIISFIKFAAKAFFLGKKINQIDLVLTYSPPLSAAYLGKRLAHYHGKPFFLELADAWPEVPIEMGIIKNPFLVKFLKSQTKKIYQTAHHIFTFSDGIKDEVLKYDIPTDKVKVIYNGADLERFDPIKSSSREIVTFIYTGTIGIANRVDQLLNAARNIERLGRVDIRFVIIGDGNDQQRVMRDFNNNPCNLVKFYESVPRKDLKNFLNKADVGLVSFAPYPILETNSATKFYDYLALGLPVIINYQGWQAGYLQAFQCGLSSPQGNLEQFVNNILTLADNPSLRQEMGNNGRKLAEEKFDRKKMAVQELELIKNSLS